MKAGHLLDQIDLAGQVAPPCGDLETILHATNAEFGKQGGDFIITDRDAQERTSFVTTQ